MHGLLGDLVQGVGVLQHFHAPLPHLPGPLALLLRLGVITHLGEDVLQQLRDLLPLLAALLVQLLGGVCGLLNRIDKAHERDLPGVRGDEAPVVCQHGAAPVDGLAIEVRHHGARLLRNEGAGRVVREVLYAALVVEAVGEVPDDVGLAPRQPAVLYRAVRHVELGVLRAQDLAYPLGVAENVLPQAGAHGYLQLVGAKHVVEAIVAALDLLANLQRQRLALQLGLAQVYTVLPLRDHQLRPSAVALGSEEERHPTGVRHGAHGVVKDEHGAVDEA
mmetsp:Transcript_404/g.1325  ORF Transcript_404/g.1325 Transcript_404/m.1325 type:complete len:276 (+) Transcript_404:181-1008(+)